MKGLAKCLAALLFVSLVLAGCEWPSTGRTSREVVVYTSVDQVYAEPILKDFERQSGIKVKPVYDVEAAKTTGLVNRLIAERDKPQADVFWSSEFVQTILLQHKGVLAAYKPKNAEDIPEQFRDKKGYWTAFGGRARVLLVNTDRLKPSEYPRSIYDLASNRWPAEKVGMAYPMFGTTATHAAALYAYLGTDKAREYYESLKKRGIRIVDGNSVVRDMVVSGELYWGITDTDDAGDAIKKGAHVALIYPDQDSMGTLIVPNTVALVKGARHRAEAQKLIEYLISKEVEQKLTDAGFIQVPCRTLDRMPEGIPAGGIKGMKIDFARVFGAQEKAKNDMTSIFVR